MLFRSGKVARLFEHKGHEDLFAVAPTLALTCPHLKFLLVGDGVLRSRFEQGVRDLGLTSQFIFTGLVPPSEVPALLGVMDALVHLSRREGLARALPQALAAGKPVIAYDCDGAREVCRDGETGFLLPAGSTTQLAQRLEQLALDAKLCERLGTRGRELVKDLFPSQRMVDELHALYLRLMAARTK